MTINPPNPTEKETENSNNLLLMENLAFVLLLLMIITNFVLFYLFHFIHFIILKQIK